MKQTEVNVEYNDSLGLNQSTVSISDGEFDYNFEIFGEVREDLIQKTLDILMSLEIETEVTIRSSKVYHLRGIPQNEPEPQPERVYREDVRSLTEFGKFYTISYFPDRETNQHECTCPDYKYRGNKIDKYHCKHIKSLLDTKFY
jgi:hypothetical protein